MRNKLICGLIALIAAAGVSLPAQAADRPAAKDNLVRAEPHKQDVKALPPGPITIEGDELLFNDKTGEVYAKGMVKVTQDDGILRADLISGNTKQTEVWIDGKAHLTQPKLELDGYDSFYNYASKTGNMFNAKGVADGKYIVGNNIEFYPDYVVIHDGTITKCPAKRPDYHVSGDKIEIYPNDKMIIHNAKFWIKDKIIYTRDKYVTRIGDNAQDNNIFPRPGYDSDDGVYIAQSFDAQLSDDVTAYADLAYYSKAGFRPEYGLQKWDEDYTIGAVYGYFKDANDEWVKKKPEFRFDYKPHRIGNTPLSYSFYALYGKWSDDYKSSWHQEYAAYLSHDPIRLTDTWSLNLGAGYQIIKESYDGSQINTMRYDAVLNKHISRKLNGWVGYHYSNSANTLFAYNRPDMNKELDTGFSYRFDHKNTLIFNQSYDIENGRVYDQDFTWLRDLHCWQAMITYRAKRSELKVDFMLTRW